jgi:hypothetical protein
MVEIRAEKLSVEACILAENFQKKEILDKLSPNYLK